MIYIRPKAAVARLNFR